MLQDQQVNTLLNAYAHEILEDALKVDADDQGIGGEDAANACRYLVATKRRELRLRILNGL